MAQAGFTPIQLYRTTTASAVPTAGNLAAGELAINLTDKKLYAKDASNNVFLLADASSGGTTATNLAGGAAGSLPYQTGANATTFRAIGTAGQVLQVNSGATAPEWVNSSGTGDVARTTSPTFTTPILGTPTSVTLTNATGLPLTTGVTGTLSAANGGTGQASYTTGDLLYATGSTALSKLGIGTNGQILTSTGTAPQWDTLSGVAVTTFSAGTTGFTPNSATSGAVTLAGTLATTNGGTGLTSFTANGVVYASSTSALATGSALTFDGTKALTVGTGTATQRASITLDGGANAGIGAFYGINVGGSTVGVVSSSGYAASDTSTDLAVYGDTGKAVRFYANGSEQMRLTSTGLGIGTSSPITKLSNTSTTWSGGIATDGLVWRSTQNDWTAAVLGTPATGAGYGLRVHTLGTTSSDYPFWISSGAGAGSVLAAMTGAGNLGIGTSSPASKLEVYNSAVNAAFVASNPATWRVAQVRNDGTANANNAAGIAFVGRTDVNPAGIVAINSTTGGGVTSLAFLPVNSNLPFEAMRLDSSGNLGLGVAPSAWGTNLRTIDIGFGTALTNANSTTDTWLSSNAYYTTQWLYKNNAEASYYQQASGAHRWYTAPSGTAGNAISFTQAMTLDASGNLQLGGTTNKVTGLSGGGTGMTIQASSAPTLAIWDTSDATWYSNLGQISDNFYLYNVSATGSVLFGTNNTERARIPAAGGMVVGTAALATTATDGFLYVPTCAGTPTGTPTTQTGTAPIVVDTTNNKLYFYSGGQWRDAGP